jgi:hypothetical protein
MTKFSILIVVVLVLLSCSVYGFSVGFCFVSKLPACEVAVNLCKSGGNKFVCAHQRKSSFHVQPHSKTRQATQTSVGTVQTDFDLNRGAAIDTLLNDYPALFERTCDFSIFTEEIVLEDVQGFRIEGMRAYKAFFTVVSSIVNVCFSHCETSVVLMDKYALDKSRIKLRWRKNLFSRLPGSLRDIFRWIDSDGNGIISSYEYSALHQRQFAKATPQQEPFVVEGISVYKLNSKGKIIHHSIEITSPLSSPLAPLRELLPVNMSPTMVPLLSNYQLEALPNSVSIHQPIGNMLDLSTPTSMLSLKSTNMGQGEQPMAKFGGPRLQAFMKKLPKQCKEDYDCNPGIARHGDGTARACRLTIGCAGGYNFPLRCMDFIIARFCVDPDDWRNGGLGALAWDPSLAPEPIPVRVEDGFTGPR